ncbi:Nucleolar protein 10 [Geodia barretti]|uniref:Nucleolar protein 10 n=1 Tax=Geodia barretti TaxID=519541 RepID=A0AA35QT07_GEOBA|nr:Nucleolar protein 10 [Geodia barretti]
MQVTTAGGVKVYNLSAGKSLPEWISERKRRALLKNDLGLRRRIELLQDFSMPIASTGIQVTADGQYIMASGVYKPRIRCYDVKQLSMKFERCLDAEIVKFHMLSEDYSKFVCLLSDRQLEIHAQYGFYYRTRIPKFGRDLSYHSPSCDLYIVGASSEVYRLNLDQGRYMAPLHTNARSCTVCEINPHHQLLTIGTEQGGVECWDPRSNTRCGQMAVSLDTMDSGGDTTLQPAVTALKYKNSLTLAVGTASGQVLLYDLRTPTPFLEKDHHYSIPVHSIAFQRSQDLVLSADAKALRIWHCSDGSPFTAIEPEHAINSVCYLPETGMVFMACEDSKMLSYYIPAVGHAPRWCSFLDSLTEELEEAEPVVYDDYKFVTSSDLDTLGLSHLVGTNLLRGYMHGYFMDIRLYHKAKAVSQPFAYREYRKEKIRQKIDEQRASRVKEKKVLRVNSELAKRLMEDTKKTVKDVSNPLGDNRFAAMFSDANFQIDEESEEFRAVHPVLAKAKLKKKKLEEKQADIERGESEEREGRPSDESSSSDEEEERAAWREVARLRRSKMAEEGEKGSVGEEGAKVEMVAVSGGDRLSIQRPSTVSRASLGKRLEREGGASLATPHSSSLGNKEMKFSLKKSEVETTHKQRMRDHRIERRKLGRSAKKILPKTRNTPVFWKGRRVK